MTYIPISGLNKEKSGYIPISGLPQIAKPMAESTIAVAPQGEGFLSGLYQKAKTYLGGLKTETKPIAEKPKFEYQPPFGISKITPQFISEKAPIEKPELPTEFPKTERFVETLKEIARTFPREGAGAVLETIERIKGIPPGSLSITPGAGEIFPREKYLGGPEVEKFIFGEKPVESLSRQGKETLKGFGMSENQAEQFGLIAGMVFLGLDLLPAGGDDVIKLLVKANKSKVTKKILFGLKEVDNAKITDEVVETITKSTDPEEIKRLVENLKVGRTPEIPKGTWISDKSAPGFGVRGEIIGEGILGKDIPAYKIRTPSGKITAIMKEDARIMGEIIPSEIPKELEPLAQEARKYKSAEEFIQSVRLPS